MEFEKYIPRRIIKDISPEAIHPGGQRVLQPGDCVDAVNCRIYSSDGDGNQYLVENIRGNSQLSFALPAGQNKCIGHFLYNKYNAIVYFIWNSTGEHRVIQWTYDTQAFTVLLQGSSLNFDRDHYINQGGILDDNMIFNDRFNRPRKANLARAASGGYTAPYAEWVLTLISRPPLMPPTAAFITDSGFQFNYVSRSVWQFAYRFVYLDGETSVFSPLSLLMYWGLSFNLTNLTNNVINVTIQIPSELVPFIRTVEVAYREGNIGNYFVFNQIQSPSVNQYTVKFYGNDVATAIAPEDSVRLYDVVPPVTEALGIIKNRVFVVLNDLGFDVPATFALTVSVGTETQVAGRRYAKQGGSYNVGIIFSDNYGATTFVKSKQTIAFPYGGRNQFVRWSLSGTPPADVVKYQIVMSLNNAQELYSQFQVIPYLYVSDQPPDTDEGAVYTDYFIWRGKKFRKLENGTQSNRGTANYQYVYLQMPLNLPIIPDTTYYIKFLDPAFPSAQVLPILGIDADFIVLAPIKSGGTVINWNLFCPTQVEIFTPVLEQDSRFFEVGQIFDIVNGNFSVGNGRIDGDAYELNSGIQSYYTPLVLKPNPYVPPEFDFANSNGNTGAIESPSGVVSTSLLSVDSAVNRNILRPQLDQISKPVAVNQVVSKTVSIPTLDYNKVASDWGRVHVENNNEKKEDQNTSVQFSDPFFQNTLVFGVNTFRAENKYDIPRDRSPIRAFKKANQILLAIHERNTSSMYIGEGLIRQGNDFVLAKTDAVIGDNRELEFNYGCINPESIIEVYGHVYWWDAYRGAVVRYTNAGLFDISAYGMATYFHYKGRAYEPYRNQIKVITGYDFLNEEFIISFPAIADIAAETWAFSPKNNVWLPRYSYVPEWMAFLNNNLFSFNNGQMWIHHKNALFNNFYGVQYQRYFDLICNPKLGKSKRLLNVHVKGQLTQDPNSENQVVVITTKEGQQTFIPAYEFELDEGKYVAPVLKDINTPNMPSGTLALRSGDDMVSNYFIVRVINDRTDKGECSQVNVVFKTEEFSI